MFHSTRLDVMPKVRENHAGQFNDLPRSMDQRQIVESTIGESGALFLGMLARIHVCTRTTRDNINLKGARANPIEYI